MRLSPVSCLSPHRCRRSCLIILGGLTLCNAFFGCIGSCYYRSLLSIYLMIGTLLTIAQVRPFTSRLELTT